MMVLVGNHIVELVVPWMLFMPRGWRQASGLVNIAFQGLACDAIAMPSCMRAYFTHTTRNSVADDER